MNAPRTRRAPSRSSRMRGVALLEVLVALLIFMLGVLGLVGLQGTLTKAETDTKFRADAAYLAGEGISRLWSDLNNMNSYAGTGCTAVARCQEWLDKIATRLPKGTGTLDIDALTGDVTVTVNWTLPNGQAHQFITHTTVAKKAS